MDVVSRRLELLKLEGLGFSQAEIVKQLSQKCGCSGRTVYRDFETRESWQPVVQSVIDARRVLLKVVNRYEQIYRQASVRLLTFSEESCQLGALNTMLKATQGYNLIYVIMWMPETPKAIREDLPKKGDKIIVEITENKPPKKKKVKVTA